MTHHTVVRMIAHIAVDGSASHARTGTPGGLQVVVERPHHGIEQPQPRQPDGHDGQGEGKEERAAEDGAERDAPVQEHGEDQRHREDGQRARHGVEGGVDEAHLEPAVLEQLLVVGEPDEAYCARPRRALVKESHRPSSSG